MPKSRKKTKRIFKVGDQVIYDHQEYIVHEASKKGGSYIKLIKRFRPYSRGSTSVQAKYVKKNDERRRQSLDKSMWVFYDVDSGAPALSYIIRRMGDIIEIQPRHVRHTYFVSIYSNCITTNIDPLSVPERDYIPRVPCLYHRYLQARVTVPNRHGTGIVMDYEPVADLFLVSFYNGCYWYNPDDINVVFTDKDPYNCQWIKVGELKFDYLSFSIHFGKHYTKNMLDGGVDMESIRRYVWYMIERNGINHFAQSYSYDIEIFEILMWLENHCHYWKKQETLHFQNNDFMKKMDRDLLDVYMRNETIDMSTICKVKERDNISEIQRRKAFAIESKIRSKPIFKTDITYSDGMFKVDIMQPENAKIRAAGFGRSFMFKYITKVLWHISNKPTAPTWVETQTYQSPLPRWSWTTDMKVPLKPFQERVVYDMRQKELETQCLLSLNTKEGVRFDAVSGYNWCSIVKGGILALKTGMGKTVCTLALIRAQREIKPTLIVLPLTLMDQWISELKRFTDLTYGEIHGRKNNIEEAVKNDVVFTTYGTLLSNYNKDSSSGLFLAFHRVVFDESHQLKTQTSSTVAACWAVNASFRWCLTATPFRKGSFMNIHPQLKMLNIRPFTIRENWFRHILEREDQQSKWILSRLGSIIINPNLQDYVSLPDPENIEYRFLHSDHAYSLINVLYDRYRDKIRDIWRNHGCYGQFSKVMSFINKISMAAMDPSLIDLSEWGERCGDSDFTISSTEDVSNRLDDNKKFELEVKKTLETLEETTCTLCLETVTRPTITNCLHIYCHDCIKRSLEFKKACPICRQTLHERDFVEIKTTNTVDKSDGYTYMNDALGRRVKVKDDVVNMYNNTGSEKLEKLKRIVEERSKVVVYSQYNTVLEHYSKHIRSSIITGKSSRSQRKKNIEKFIHGETQVFFLSTKVADVGINLTEGDTLVFLEPGIDPEVRTQAIGRLQRIGQEKRICIYDMIAGETIEERIQVHKKEYHEAILNIMSSDGSKSSKSKAKKRFLLRYIVKILNLN